MGKEMRWLIKTSYEVRKDDKGEEYCITPCPLGKRTVGETRIMAGSCNCGSCRRFVEDDKIKQVITCRCTTKQEYLGLMSDGKKG